MEELLREILKELKYHGKLLESMVEMMDAGRHKQREAKMEVGDKLEKLASMMEGSPFAGILRETAKTLGGNHGE